MLSTSPPPLSVRKKKISMDVVTLSLPPDVLALVEKQARMRYKDRAAHIRDLVISALTSNGSLVIRADD